MRLRASSTSRRSVSSPADTARACTGEADLVDGRLAPRLRGPPGLDDLVLDPAEEGRAEDLLEELALVLGPGPQERRELALRQDHGLHELVAGRARRRG